MEEKITFQKPWFRRRTLSVPHAGNMGPLERYTSNLIMSGSRVQADFIIVMIFVIGGYGHGKRDNGEDRDGFPSFLERYFWAPRFLQNGVDCRCACDVWRKQRGKT